VFPIPGTKRIHYLQENIAAFHIKLSAEDKQQLEAVFAADQVGVCFLLSVQMHQCAFPVVKAAPAIAGLNQSNIAVISPVFCQYLLLMQLHAVTACRHMYLLVVDPVTHAGKLV